MNENQERTLAAACHGSMLVVSFVGPLLIWLMKRNESPLIDKNGKEALNLFISIMTYSFICLLLALVIIGIFMLYALALFTLIVIIRATIKIYSVQSYRYPFIFRLIK